MLLISISHNVAGFPLAFSKDHQMIEGTKHLAIGMRRQLPKLVHRHRSAQPWHEIHHSEAGSLGDSPIFREKQPLSSNGFPDQNDSVLGLKHVSPHPRKTAVEMEILAAGSEACGSPLLLHSQPTNQSDFNIQTHRNQSTNQPFQQSPIDSLILFHSTPS
jgi:hypothetical protein